MTFVTAALIGGGLAAAGGLGAAAINYFGSQNAANAQVSAENTAIGYMQGQAAKQQPFINVGQGAVNQLGGLFGIGANGMPTTAPVDYSQFYNSPDYQFAQQQGNLAVQRYENANGSALSGGALKDIAQFNQGLASQQYGNYFNRLMQLATLGSNAANSNNQAAAGIGNMFGLQGQSVASGIIGGANAISGGIGSAVGGINSSINNSLLYNALSNNQNRSSYGGPLALPGSYNPSPSLPNGQQSGGLY